MRSMSNVGEIDACRELKMSMTVQDWSSVHFRIVKGTLAAALAILNISPLRTVLAGRKWITHEYWHPSQNGVSPPDSVG